MARSNAGAKALSSGKSKEKKNKGNEGVHGSRIRMKLKLLFSCIAFGFRPNRSSIDNDNVKNQDGDQVGKASSNTKCSSARAAQSSRRNNNLNPNLRVYTHFHNFSYNDLNLATRNFKRENFLGEGGFGKVFKGWLSNDQMYPSRPGIGIPVAVKTLNLGGLQGHTEWLVELNYLSQLQHPKLVKLIGFCIEGDKRLLVYEFMARGSVDLHLFRRSTPFPWSTRMRIMLDAAEGLAYLHQEDDNKRAVIFRDFKTSNILVDREFNAKISDFGLAKDGPMGGRTHVSTRLMGTQGYAAPEYVMTGRLTTKSDVYSFGVVLLEMVTGKRVIDRHRPIEERNMVPWAVRQVKDGGRLCHMILVDPRLHGQYSKKGALKALRLAAKCVSRNPSARPEMSEVLAEMKVLPTMVEMAYHEASPSPPPPPPSPSSHHATQDGSSSSSGGHGLRMRSSPSGIVPSEFKASPSSFTQDKA